jgi:hypothetical protein
MRTKQGFRRSIAACRRSGDGVFAVAAVVVDGGVPLVFWAETGVILSRARAVSERETAAVFKCE